MQFSLNMIVAALVVLANVVFAVTSPAGRRLQFVPAALIGMCWFIAEVQRLSCH